MDGARPTWTERTRARYVRMRWRRAGAWLWPSFVALTLLDGAIGRLLPPAGSTETFVAGALLGLVINVIAVILFSRPLGMLVRRVRPDMPTVVARDYGTSTDEMAALEALTKRGFAEHETNGTFH